MKLKNCLSCLTTLGICTFILFGCKPEVATLPVVSTTTATSITGCTAVSGGTVSDDGGASVTARGICWGTKTNPTLDDSLSIDGQGVGNFTSNISNLLPNTSYFVRAYATSSVGTAYGKVIGFSTGKLPKVTTNISFIKITTTSFTCGGSVTSDGGEMVTAKGVCWSTNSSPTINDNKTTDGMLIGDFTSTVTGLTINTTYYVRAYATSAYGTSYGEEGIVKTLDVSQTVTDIDGNIYHTISIGTQTWLVENLKTTKYQNGDAIPTTSTPTMNISTETSPKYQWAYNVTESNVVTYGRLYTWYATTDSRNIAPTGWHVATESDWTLLENYLIASGYNNNSGAIILTVANSLAAKTNWSSSTTNGAVGYKLSSNNSTGFSALPGGGRYDTSFLGLQSEGYWWTAAEDNSTNFNVRYLVNNSISLAKSTFNKYYGLSVKCVKN